MQLSGLPLLMHMDLFVVSRVGVIVKLARVLSPCCVTYFVAEDLDLALREGLAAEEHIDLLVKVTNLLKVDSSIFSHILCKILLLKLYNYFYK